VAWGNLAMHGSYTKMISQLENMTQAKHVWVTFHWHFSTTSTVIANVRLERLWSPVLPLTPDCWFHQHCWVRARIPSLSPCLSSWPLFWGCRQPDKLSSLLQSRQESANSQPEVH